MTDFFPMIQLKYEKTMQTKAATKGRVLVPLKDIPRVIKHLNKSLKEGSSLLLIQWRPDHKPGWKGGVSCIRVERD